VRIGVIDVGTNSTLLLIADALSEASIKPVFQDTVSTRLGRGITTRGTIQDKNLYKTIETVKAYCTRADAYGAEKILIVGTAPFRNAKNGAEAREAIEKQSGMTLEVLPAEAEALWTFRGACTGRHIQGAIAAADIGGGSTEVIFSAGQNAGDILSLQVGAVSLAESLGLPESPDSIRRYAARRDIAAHFPESMVSQLEKVAHVIAIGGTATTLAWLASELSSYDHERIDGMCLSRQVIEKLVTDLSAGSLETRRRMLHLDPERADIIVPGGLILQALLDCSGPDSIIVSDRGLRFGIALRAVHSL